jgi:hypothetical protein
MPAFSVEENKTYKPGQMVPVSGIYTVMHEDHREPHQSIALRGEEFPSCRICKDNVRFYVARVVPHITHDFDLTGPRPVVLKARAKAANKGSS